MTHVSILAAAALAVWQLAAAGTAEALTVVNRDAGKQSFVVIEDGRSQEVTLAPGQTSADLCKSKCVVRLTSGEEYELEGSEVVSIDGDMLFIEETAPAAGRKAKR